MISRRIARKPENDNYRRLANYIAGAAGRGDKCLLTWCSGCWMGDNYELAIDEVVDTQALNTRATKEKTYHLLVSFRPEDEAALTPALLKEVEQDFAKALGLEEHQRHCAVHKNTNNLHLHVAYNLIHPEKLTRREPYRDYLIRDRLCRDLEQRLALSVDNGREHAREIGATPLSDAAATVEAHTGQQSFEGYVRERREPFLAALEKATTWSDLHRVLAEQGLTIKPHGNGLAIVSNQGQHAIKASRLDRGFSKSNLEKRFGPYQAPDKRIEQLQPATVYNAKPLHRAPERGELYAEYQAGITKRNAALTLIKEQETIGRETLAETWKRKRQEVEAMALTKRDKFRLLRLVRQHEADARKRLAMNHGGRRQSIAAEVPFASWSEFLRGKALQGNEVALAILRSRKQEIHPEPEAPERKVTPQPTKNIIWRAQINEIKNTDALRPVEKRDLAAIARMHALAAEEAAAKCERQLKDFTYRIDGKGTVLFTLASGGMVRDAGEQVLWSAQDKAAERVGLQYAQAKWENCVMRAQNDVSKRVSLPSKETGISL